MPLDNITKAVSAALGEHLKENMKSLEQVIYDFPSPNVQLLYPSLSIMTGNPTFTAETPYILDQGEMDDETKMATVSRVVGTYEFDLQLDFWCRDKLERFRLYDEFFSAFHKDVDPMGLNLQLSTYYDVWCRYDQSGYRYEDRDIGSQRGEWRIIVSLLAQCRAVLEKSEFIIETIENNLTTPNTIII